MICCIYAITHTAEASRRPAHAIAANAAAAVALPRPVALTPAFENTHRPKIKSRCIYGITHAADLHLAQQAIYEALNPSPPGAGAIYAEKP